MQGGKHFAHDLRHRAEALNLDPFRGTDQDDARRKRRRHLLHNASEDVRRNDKDCQTFPSDCLVQRRCRPHSSGQMGARKVQGVLSRTNHILRKVGLVHPECDLAISLGQDTSQAGPPRSGPDDRHRIQCVDLLGVQFCDTPPLPPPASSSHSSRLSPTPSSPELSMSIP